MRARNRIAVIPAVLLCLLGPLLRGGEPQAGQGERLFLWKAVSAEATVHLLGSIHVGLPDFYPLPAEMEQAFAAADNLVVEVNMAAMDRATMQKAVMEKGSYSGDDTLSQKLSKPTLEMLTAYCEKNGMALAALNKFKPWLVGMTLAMVEIQKAGFRPDLGIDMHFIKAAGKKPILELESANSQFDLLSSFPDELQDAMLKNMLGESGKVREKFGKMAAAWKKGDVDELDEMVLKSELKKYPELKPFHEKLFDERNVQMAGKIGGYLKGKGSYFVVVGAGHLIGEKGIVTLLKKQGFTVEQVRGAAASKTTPPPVPAGR